MTRDQYVAHVRMQHTKAGDMVEKKSEDYTGSGDPFDSFTVPAKVMGTSPEAYILGLITMKLIRIKSILEKGQANNESAGDSLLDISNYALILDAMIESKKPLI